LTKSVLFQTVNLPRLIRLIRFFSFQTTQVHDGKNVNKSRAAVSGSSKSHEVMLSKNIKIVDIKTLVSALNLPCLEYHFFKGWQEWPNYLLIY